MYYFDNNRRRIATFRRDGSEWFMFKSRLFGSISLVPNEVEKVFTKGKKITVYRSKPTKEHLTLRFSKKRTEAIQNGEYSCYSFGRKRITFCAGGVRTLFGKTPDEIYFTYE